LLSIFSLSESTIGGKALYPDILLQVPAIIKVLATLGLILLLSRMVGNLIVSIAAGGLVLGLWSGHSVAAVGRIAWERFSSIDNLLLMLVICLIIWLSSLMAKTGVMQDMVETLKQRVPRRLSFAVLPAVIGLLPMPGGAMFSAPMVDSVDSSKSIPGLLKAQTNYWFRHVWEYWWPLYPGVILAMDITGLEIWQIFIIGFPVSVLAIGAGYAFLLRRIPREAPRREYRTGSDRSFFLLTAPILAVIVVYVSLLLLFPDIKTISRYLPITAGLFVSLAVLQVQRRPDGSVWAQVLKSRRTVSMSVLVAVIRIYGAMIEARLPGGILLVEQMRSDLALIGVPEHLFIVFIPMVTGLAVGINVGTIGASFPVVLTLLGSSPPHAMLLQATVLAYTAGFMGQMLSPVHVCLVVSNDYFKSSQMRSLAGMLLPVLCVLAGSWLFSFLIRYLG
jgi:hypothetical protein